MKGSERCGHPLLSPPGLLSRSYQYRRGCWPLAPRYQVLYNRSFVSPVCNVETPVDGRWYVAILYVAAKLRNRCEVLIQGVPQ